MPADLKPLAPREAVDFFRKKGYRAGFSWQDVWHEEHAYGFTVAKAMRNDILQDIRGAVDEAITGGVPFKEFAKKLEPTLADKGWWGRKEMIDPKTGEKKLVQLGSPRRLKTIYQTNLRSAYSAGRWERIQRTKKTRPYLRYVAILDDNTRDQHRAWHDIILPVDHPFWQQFYPPNGWGCRCTVQQLSERDLERRGLKVSADDTLPNAKRTFTNKRTGEIIRVPQGIDPGFSFNIGRARMKALTPPPLDRPLNIPFAGRPAKIPMPDPRNLGGHVLYQDGLLDKQYVRKFLREFDKGGKPNVFMDVMGEPVIISEDLFKTASGRLKFSKDLRVRYLGVLARTIKDPDEIWHVWEEYPKGRMTLRRKYIARFKVGDEDVPAFILFDTNEDGWNGVTAFRTDKETYITKQRNGALIYRRTDTDQDKK
ncbi:MAG: PBECR2 nuclease fold domain-containing protein [Alphaproteobacteria bacterium]|jgi:SPP1 gp7 family putative phage head morphogenesis protein|nr:PBECR2 nuclease fold domain-containing protein [Alphaproteobacteria bacterium]